MVGSKEEDRYARLGADAGLYNFLEHFGNRVLTLPQATLHAEIQGVGWLVLVLAVFGVVVWMAAEEVNQVGEGFPEEPS